MCSVYTTSDLTLCTASIVNLCAISVDRYLVISSPLRYSAKRTTKRIMVYIACVWIIAAIVSISSHIIANLLDDGTYVDDTGTCQVSRVPLFTF
uniref:G_PROTEIN_RECEP_F1_2 domain-containing protein n=1 Tax=Caenorhabditis tropicalis TaxID=1561998 RepID=A0A1I7TCS3_9PELO